MLPAHYYLHNFHALVHFVRGTYADLLDTRELEWASAFLQLPQPAQCLYVRLSSRSGSSFRLGKLDYPEIGPLQPARDALAVAGLARCEPPADPPTLLGCFVLPELRRLCAVQDRHCRTREQVVQGILGSDEALLKRHCRVLQAADDWVTLEGQEIHRLFMLCFFGNHYQDLSEFVRRDLGTLRLVAYPLDGSSRAFSSRRQIEAHQQLWHCEFACEALARMPVDAILTLERTLPASDPADTHLHRRVERLRNRLARQLERLGALNDALQLYALTSRTPARERRVRVLVALGRPAEAH